MEIAAMSAPPAVPSKWDIIPIHASDVASFLRCRRYWDWSSPARLNLRHKVQIYGVNVPLWFGSGIHYALEMYYNPTLKRDPVEAFTTWFDYQWNGGIVTEEWLDRTYDLEPQQVSGVPNADPHYHLEQFFTGQKYYKIRGLQELLPDPDHEEFEQHRELGIGMLNFYKEWAPRNDQFIVVAAESVFSVPMGFEAVDVREDSPNYGKKTEVHLRGKRDAVLYFPLTERYGINDYKTAAPDDPDNYFAKLTKDAQCLTYMFASQEEAKYYGLPYTRIDCVLYTVLWKKYPRPPSVLKDGVSPSINRQEESTTAELFAAHIKEQGIKEIYDNNPKWQAYYNWLVEKGDRQFVDRKVVRYNKHELAAHGQHLRWIAEDMLDPNTKIYPTPTSSWSCTRCQFRVPCIAADDGSDFVHMLADGYETNRDR